MSGEERRGKIIQALKNSDKAVSATTLAKEFDVSRQVIVQDVALLPQSYGQTVHTPLQQQSLLLLRLQLRYDYLSAIPRRKDYTGTEKQRQSSFCHDTGKRI